MVTWLGYPCCVYLTGMADMVAGRVVTAEVATGNKVVAEEPAKAIVANPPATNMVTPAANHWLFPAGRDTVSD